MIREGCVQFAVIHVLDPNLVGLGLRGHPHGGVFGLLPTTERLYAKAGFLQLQGSLHSRHRDSRRKPSAIPVRHDPHLLQVQVAGVPGLGQRFPKSAPFQSQLGLHGFVKQFNVHGGRHSSPDCP